MRSKAMNSNRADYLFTDAGKVIVTVLVLALSLLMASCAGPLQITGQGAYYRPDPVMGDWEVSVEPENGDGSGFVAQAIALGDGKYRFQFLDAFDKGAKPMVVLNGELQGKTFTFEGEGWAWSGTGSGTIEGDLFRGTYEGDSAGKLEMRKVVRLSPTLGAKPPADAVVLFDGTNFDEWKHHGDEQEGSVRWRLVDGAMEIVPKTGSIMSKKEFRDFKMHLEFRTPFMPDERGQGRGNSGVYFQGMYEVQVLDSYGLEGLDNECGGIYKVASPSVNMCAPPMQWQSYDVIFYAPRLDDAGRKTRSARLTVLHNGIKIQDGTEIPGPTGAAESKEESGVGGIYLQDHGDPVQYRNIWLVELPE